MFVGSTLKTEKCVIDIYGRTVYSGPSLVLSAEITPLHHEKTQQVLMCLCRAEPEPDYGA